MRIVPFAFLCFAQRGFHDTSLALALLRGIVITASSRLAHDTGTEGLTLGIIPRLHQGDCYYTWTYIMFLDGAANNIHYIAVVYLSHLISAMVPYSMLSNRCFPKRYEKYYGSAVYCTCITSGFPILSKQSTMQMNDKMCAGSLRSVQ